MDENWAALCIAIIKEVEPEEAFFLFTYGHEKDESALMTMHMGRLAKEMTKEEIAKHYNVSFDVVRGRIDNLHKAQKARKRERVSKEIVRMWSNGHKRSDIAETMGVTVRKVHDVISSYTRKQNKGGCKCT